MNTQHIEGDVLTVIFSRLTALIAYCVYRTTATSYFEFWVFQHRAHLLMICTIPKLEQFIISDKPSTRKVQVRSYNVTNIIPMIAWCCRCVSLLGHQKVSFQFVNFWTVTAWRGPKKKSLFCGFPQPRL